MNLTLVRHGETEENKNLILIGGGRHGTLSKNGIEQAENIALELRDRHFDAIYSSDLARALDTAKAIVKYHQDTPFHVVKDLREIDVGDAEGKSFKTLDELFAAGLGPNKTGETLEHFQDRLKKFLRSIYTKYRNKDILFVCHGGVIKAYQNIMEHASPSEINKRKSSGNATALTLKVKSSDLD